jgi:hypothetical protein
MRHRRIYVASSWRNGYQPQVVLDLRAAGHEVYDFRNPAPGIKGFAWSEIDREWLTWTPAQYAALIASSPVAAAGFKLDKAALDWCDTCVLVLPCGRSAHLEAGYTAGQGKDTYFLLHEDKFEPELMYLLGTKCATSTSQIIGWMAESEPFDVARWHVEAGGTFTWPKSHALRLLREVIELCIACGAKASEITSHVDAEFAKADDKKEWGGDSLAIPEEWADCALLLEVFRSHAGIERHQEVREKLKVLWDREWAPDPGGALYRPAPTRTQ